MSLMTEALRYVPSSAGPESKHTLTLATQVQEQHAWAVVRVKGRLEKTKNPSSGHEWP